MEVREKIAKKLAFAQVTPLFTEQVLCSPAAYTKANTTLD
jgi:hypothetical protein